MAEIRFFLNFIEDTKDIAYNNVNKKVIRLFVILKYHIYRWYCSKNYDRETMRSEYGIISKCTQKEVTSMAKPIGIGEDDFADLIQDGCFYIDKTMLIKEWWENRDKVTLITRPRRFGKTLNMSMLERFWSNQ